MGIDIALATLCKHGTASATGLLPGIFSPICARSLHAWDACSARQFHEPESSLKRCSTVCCPPALTHRCIVLLPCQDTAMALLDSRWQPEKKEERGEEIYRTIG